MSRFVIFPWKKTSEGAQLLKKELEAEWVEPLQTVGEDVVVINWGNGYANLPRGNTIFNKTGINTCTSKISTYKALAKAGVPTCEWTKSQDQALEWWEAGTVIYGRDDDNGMDGKGITVYATASKAPRSHGFYTKRFKADREFRVNCAFGEVIDVREKKNSTGEGTSMVRCGDNWLWYMNNLEPYSPEVKLQAVAAVKALGLDFGGCDVGLSSNGSVCVLEVNSAPWLTELLARRYANAFRQRV